MKPALQPHNYSESVMISVQFTEAGIKELQYERFHHPHPRVQIRMEALLLKSQGLKNKEICKIIGITPNTLTKYLRLYQQYGIDGLKEINFYKPKSELEKYAYTIEDYFRKHPPATIKEAMAKIEELTGIKRSEVQVRKFLKKIGFKRRKLKMIPAKADPDKQKEFKNDKLNPRLDEAKKGERAVYFVDAAHFVLAPFLGYLWSLVQVFIKAPTGRKRFNVLGALNAITHELIMVTNDTYINAGSVCDLLWELFQIHSGEAITLVLDNASYQRSVLVQSLASFLNIELLYLPSYSPNLNLIERLWKFVKKEVLYSKYYDDFSKFKESISDLLKNMNRTHKKELDSLLTLRFQTFKKSQILAA